MKILSINAGSSSLKFTLFEMDNESSIVSGVFERIGLNDSFYTIKINGEKITEKIDLSTHTIAVKVLLNKLLDLNIIKSYDEIKGVGHRILHGGEKYSSSVIIDDEVIESIKDLTPLGPLHHPGEIAGILALRDVLPDALMVAVYDTAFHQTMSEETYLYPVPYKWYEEYNIRKYGFHGTSHKYIAERVKKILKKDKFKLISCHIGSGGSICAIKDGKCVDTSMGFTPLAGIMMGTRSGDIDPSIIPYVMEKEGKNASEIVEDLNKQSGVLGLSELCSDMRDLVSACEEGNKKAIVAKNKYIRRIVDYISSYYVLLEKPDIIVFTAGVGENNVSIRREICEKLSCLGIKIDLDLNNTRGEELKISTKDSNVLVYIIPTNEELMIARDTLRLMNR